LVGVGVDSGVLVGVKVGEIGVGVGLAGIGVAVSVGAGVTVAVGVGTVVAVGGRVEVGAWAVMVAITSRAAWA